VFRCATINPGMLPRTGDPAEAVGSLVGIVAGLSKKIPICSFTLGRTSDLAAVRTDLDCDCLFVLYVSEDGQQSGVVGDSLNRAFRGHPRFASNRREEGLPRDGSTQYVYIAIWTSARDAAKER
jgi:hypothetical protein